MEYIYKITNTLNNKCYIGETIQTPEKRWKYFEETELKGILEDNTCGEIE